MPRFTERDLRAMAEIIGDATERANDPSLPLEVRRNEARWAAHRSEQVWADQLDRDGLG